MPAEGRGDGGLAVREGARPAKDGGYAAPSSTDTAWCGRSGGG